MIWVRARLCRGARPHLSCARQTPFLMCVAWLPLAEKLQGRQQDLLPPHHLAATVCSLLDMQPAIPPQIRDLNSLPHLAGGASGQARGRRRLVEGWKVNSGPDGSRLGWHRGDLGTQLRMRDALLAQDWVLKEGQAPAALTYATSCTQAFGGPRALHPMRTLMSSLWGGLQPTQCMVTSARLMGSRPACTHLRAALSSSTRSLACLPYTFSDRRCARGVAARISSKFSCGIRISSQLMSSGHGAWQAHLVWDPLPFSTAPAGWGPSGCHARG